MTTDRFQSGMALPLVLWIFLILGLMYAGFGYGVRSDLAMTRQLVSSSKTREAAHAGVQFAIERLLRRFEEDVGPPGTVYRETFDGIDLQIAFVNEAGLVDLNHASKELLGNLLQHIVSSEEQRNTIIDSLLDWRDSDQNVREHGAEDNDYVRMGMPYTAADSYLNSVDELALIQGVTPDIFRELRGMITVHSGRSTVTPNLMPPLLLQALTGDGPDVGSEALQERLQSTLPSVMLSDRSSRAYTIEVKASMPGAATTRLSAVIELTGGRHKPYTVLSWKEVENLNFID